MNPLYEVIVNEANGISRDKDILEVAENLIGQQNFSKQGIHSQLKCPTELNKSPGQ